MTNKVYPTRKLLASLVLLASKSLMLNLKTKLKQMKRPSFRAFFKSRRVRIANEILMFFRSRKKHEGDVSINDTIDIDKDGNPLTYLDIISVDDSIPENIDLKIHTERLNALISERLSEREEKIIILRYGLRGYKPQTQKWVAKRLGISRSYVSRIEKRALLKLRDGFGGKAPTFDD